MRMMHSFLLFLRSFFVFDKKVLYFTKNGVEKWDKMVII